MAKKRINQKPFKYEIGEFINTKSGRVEILAQYRTPGSSNRIHTSKWYKYKCSVEE